MSVRQIRFRAEGLPASSALTQRLVDDQMSVDRLPLLPGDAYVVKAIGEADVSYAADLASDFGVTVESDEEV